MSRNKIGSKVGREARNRAFQEELRSRKRLRRLRAQEDIVVMGGERATVTATEVAKESWTITADPMAGREDAFYDPPPADGAVERHAKAARAGLGFWVRQRADDTGPDSTPWTEVQRNKLAAHSVPKLREIAKQRGITFTTRTRKADLIDLIVGAS